MANKNAGDTGVCFDSKTDTTVVTNKASNKVIADTMMAELGSQTMFPKSVVEATRACTLDDDKNQATWVPNANTKLSKQRAENTR